MRVALLLAAGLLVSACSSAGHRRVVVDPSEVPTLNQTRWDVKHEPAGAPADGH